MANLDDQDDTFRIVHRIHHAVVALPNAISIRVARQFLAARWSRILCQSFDPRYEPLPVALLSDGLEFPGRGPLDRKSISCHGASVP